MSLQHLSRATTADRVVEAVKRNGAVIVDRLASESEMDAVAEELAPYMAATPAGPDAFSGFNTRRTGGLVARSAQSRALITNPLILAAAGKLLEHATSFRLHLTQAIAIGPGEPAQPIHRDQWAFDFFPFPKGYEVQCNTLWAMTEFTRENGATRVAPGTHLSEDRLTLSHADTVAAEMTKGSVLIYNGAVYHGGGANLSASTRVGLNITYAASWLRQEENQYLSVPLEIARTLPVDLLKLIGYRRGAYALGYVDDLRDPLDVLFPRQGAGGFGAQAEADAARRNAETLSSS